MASITALNFDAALQLIVRMALFVAATALKLEN